LPTVNGVEQAPGREFASADAVYACDDLTASVTVDIASAYPADAAIDTWSRAFRLERGNSVTVTDSYELRGAGAPVTWNLITACDATILPDGVIALEETSLASGRTSGAGRLHYDSQALEATVEELPIEDSRLANIWGSRLSRIVLTTREPTQHGSCAVRVTR
ncbi:MAG: hypothetical protein ABGY41_10365, partial [Candidatus Poribacteria bacterium]